MWSTSNDDSQAGQGSARRKKRKRRQRWRTSMATLTALVSPFLVFEFYLIVRS